MAAGRHQCSYLITLQKQEFLLQGGDPEWLKGFNHIPTKLRNLYDINKILAHRPWLLKKSHIELDQAGGYQYHSQDLAACVGDINSSSKSKPKDIQSVDTRQDWKNTMINSPPSPTEPEVGITTLMQRMKTLSEQTEECTPVELAKRFESIETQSAEIGVVGLEPQETPADISYFVEDASFIYQDFAKRGDQDIPTFRVQDYSRDDHGYSLVNRLYNDVGNLLDDKFKTAYNLTYYTMGGRY
ncbi:hypothetical protein NQ317_017563 [Molorchus minor]|uniref:Uncharacterized protein n=1 Tax=Molorchus minor TaxID=1323400 RepID=A0ABQ9J6J5_9CUCU|nr:hypothetical protein NQ317_017563 [Molorchus minor]